MNNLAAITIGDINGIGFDILIKTWRKNNFKNYILFTDIKILLKNKKYKKLKKNLNIVNSKNYRLNYIKGKINVYSYKSSSHEDNTYKSLKFAYIFCKKKICIGIITLPLRKDLINKKIDKKFIGHTEYYQKLDNKKNANMILFHNRIIISPITTHVKIKNLPKIISKKNFIYDQISNLHKSLKIDFNIKKPKIMLSGLNPHAGENGKIGDEEYKFIKPAINQIKRKGISVEGPVSADSMLINKNLNKYDCFVFFYHDQALIPFKYISQFSGVNYTGNLDIIRVSPDHGTAYNLVGSNKISNRSFINCYKLILKIYKNRTLNVKC